MTAHWLLALIVAASVGLGAALTALYYRRHVEHLALLVDDLERELWRAAQAHYRRAR